MIRQHNTSNQVRHFCRQVFILLALLMTGISGVKAADYVLAYVNGGTTYYLARNGTTAVQRVTTFNPTTCIWSCASNTDGTTAGTLNNSNTYGYLFQTVNGTRYFLGAPDADLALATNVPNNYYRWRTNGTYVYSRYSGTNYYVNLANGVERNTTANTASNARPYEYGDSDVDLQEISSLSEITNPDGNYRLTGDASGTPGVATFRGTLDGGYYTISGLSAPLFTTLNGGTVKNVRFSNVSISGETVGAVWLKRESYLRVGRKLLQQVRRP